MPNFKTIFIIIGLLLANFFGIFSLSMEIEKNECEKDILINSRIYNDTNLKINGETPEEGNYEPYQEFWTRVYEQNASNWEYSEWRQYIIVDTYGVSEDELDKAIKNDILYENNIHILTLFVWGIYNGSLSEEDKINLKNHMIQDTVEINDISFSKNTDVELILLVNISVKSTLAMRYVADRLRIYLRSQNSTGKWYNSSEDHFVLVYDESGLELNDPNYRDGNAVLYTEGPIILNTNVVENNVTTKAVVDYYINYIMKDETTKSKLFDIVDDDSTPPIISYVYTGDKTDRNPGKIIVSALDASGLSVDPSGNYPVPNTLGIHNFTFIATDADNDRPNDNLTTVVTVEINITDDDTTPPQISYVYAGDGTDENPGTIIVSALDASGLSVDPSGNYPVPSSLGIHNFAFIATDADNDRPNDNLTTVVTVEINITDDDITPPLITWTYTGYGTDENPGTIIVSALDASGLSVDPSGNYPVPNTLGTHIFTFIATDTDNNIPNDNLTTVVTVEINIMDDDIAPPLITWTYTGDGTDENPGTIIVSALDASGLSVDPSGNYPVLNSLGTHIFTFMATDADNDRPNDTLTTVVIVEINITDDDIEAPIIDGIFYENLIYDSDVFIPVEINASDASGIKNISIEFQSKIYEAYIENNTYYFALTNPRELGNYSFTIIIEDADEDREGDSSTLMITYSFQIIDDDVDVPVIEEIIVDNPVYNNASSFLIGVNANDFSGIDKVQINFMGIIYNLTEANGIYYTSILMPTSIGNYSFAVIITDADADRNNDALTCVKNFKVVIARGISTEYNVKIEFLGFGLNPDLGVDISFIVSANVEAGTNYTVIIKFSNGSLIYTYNKFGTIVPTVFKLDNYTIEVKLNVSGQIYTAFMVIELAENNVKDLIYQELNVMRRMVSDSSYKDWRGWEQLKKLIVLFQLDLVEFLAKNDLDKIAYIVMLGIKIELTGGLSDKNGRRITEWNKSPSVKAWKKDVELREEFLRKCNLILWALKLCF